MEGVTIGSSQGSHRPGRTAELTVPYIRDCGVSFLANDGSHFQRSDGNAKPFRCVLEGLEHGAL